MENWSTRDTVARILDRLPVAVPLLATLKGYSGELFTRDLLAAAVVTLMLIPQSLAYALLAGLPPEMGLYASIVPLVVYALLGSSRILSVGPVAVVSLMSASAVGSVASSGTADYATASITLALLVGALSVGLGFLRFGRLANFLSQPVVSGFITASGILIGISQMRHILGVQAQGETLLSLGFGLATNAAGTHFATVAVALVALAILLWSRYGLCSLLRRWGLGERSAEMFVAAAPVAVIVLTTLAAYLFGLEGRGVALVGAVPRGLPAFSLPSLSLELWSQLAVPALLIAIIGFVESVAIGRTLAARRHQRIDANRELVALGAANIGSAMSAGFSVTGGFSRSVVNFDAGAQTQLASVMAAGGMALAAGLLTPALYFLPRATLAATVIVAVLSLIDLRVLRSAWRYSRSDFTAVAVTLGVTLFGGVELGVLCGMLASISLHLHRTSQPHVAVVGAVPGTEHFRSVERHNVITYRNLVSLRIDGSLYFANCGYLEGVVDSALQELDEVRHVILQCSAVNVIDLSALNALEDIDRRLGARGITLHLSEVKGPVMDGLKRTDFIAQLSGEIFLTHHQAVQRLKPEEIEPYIP